MKDICCRITCDMVRDKDCITYKKCLHINKFKSNRKTIDSFFDELNNTMFEQLIQQYNEGSYLLSKNILTRNFYTNEPISWVWILTPTKEP